MSYDRKLFRPASVFTALAGDPKFGRGDRLPVPAKSPDAAVQALLVVRLFSCNRRGFTFKLLFVHLCVHPMQVALNKLNGKIDIALLTIREDECNAVLDRFQPEHSAVGQRRYEVGELKSSDGAPHEMTGFSVCHSRPISDFTAIRHFDLRDGFLAQLATRTSVNVWCRISCCENGTIVDTPDFTAVCSSRGNAVAQRIARYESTNPA